MAVFEHFQKYPYDTVKHWIKDVSVWLFVFVVEGEDSCCENPQSTRIRTQEVVRAEDKERTRTVSKGGEAFV